MAKPLIAVLLGGKSSEHSISCLSAASVLAALDRTHFDVVAFGITEGGRWVLASDDPATYTAEKLPKIDPRLPVLTVELGEKATFTAAGKTFNVDVVFPVLHGSYGEDGTVQGMLEMFNLPYVGSGVLSSAAAMDKVAMNSLFESVGLPVAKWIHVTDQSADQIATELGLPLFIKPARAGSSVGISKCATVADIESALLEARKHDPKVIAESTVIGREIECGVLLGRASVPAEIVVIGHEFYDFDAKYIDGSTRTEVPADLPSDVVATVQEYSVRAFNAVGAEGLARVDFFYTSAGEVLINEINTMPGFTSISMYPTMWKATGIEYARVVSTLIEAAMTRPKSVLR